VSSEYDVEPIPGLPARPPQGETILWQGSPDWRSFAMSAMHVRMVFAWFGLIGAFRLASAWHDGAVTSLVWTQIAFLALLSLIAAALLCAFAFAVARTTVYTITNRRVVMRFGVALPMTVNLPYGQIDGASLRALEDGFGDIPLVLASNRGLSWMVLWPHARPWRFSRPEPMLRSIPDAASVAGLLARAFAETQPARVAAVASAPVAQDGARPHLAPAG
jgi:hypothetical protein